MQTQEAIKTFILKKKSNTKLDIFFSYLNIVSLLLHNI